MTNKLPRLPDWQLRFEAFVRERRTTPFSWGSNDCALFAVDCVQAITGIDIALPALREHRTAKEAIRALEANGGLRGIATDAIGAPISACWANTGDMVLVRVGKREALAICNGATAMGPSAHGLEHIDMSDALLCWRIS